MEYNSQRTQLNMPEYGRIIQSLVEHCKTLATKQERTEMAESIVEFIGQRNPWLKDPENNNPKVWNHLFLLAGLELDIEAPFAAPTQQELSQKPNKMPYPSLDYEYKFYGKSILQLIDKAIELEEGEEKDALIQVIANNMKKSYNVYNKEHVQDGVIFRHLKELSKNKLDITSIDSLEKSKIYYPSSGNNNNNRNFKNTKNQNQSQNKRRNFQYQKNNRK